MELLGLLVGTLLQTQVSGCASQELEMAGWLASARLEELSDERSVPESSIGGVLVLFKFSHCEELAASETSGEPSALTPDDCAKIVELGVAEESRLISKAGKLVTASTANVAVLVWANSDGAERHGGHITIAARPGVALRSVHSGYGRKGSIEQRCVADPWFRKPMSDEG